MKLLKTIRDKDLNLETPEPADWSKRTTSRAVIFDGNKNIALLYVAKKRYHKLPGGGVEIGENITEALQREALEEIGCEIMNIRELGIVEEFRNGLFEHQTSYGFIADVKGGKKSPNFTQDEISDGFEIIWLPLDEATKILEGEAGVEDYEGKFINARELAFLKEISIL